LEKLGEESDRDECSDYAFLGTSALPEGFEPKHVLVELWDTGDWL